MVCAGVGQPVPTVPGGAAARRRVRRGGDAGLGEDRAAGDGRRVREQSGDSGSAGEAEVRQRVEVGGGWWRLVAGRGGYSRASDRSVSEDGEMSRNLHHPSPTSPNLPESRYFSPPCPTSSPPARRWASRSRSISFSPWSASRCP